MDSSRIVTELNEIQEAPKLRILGAQLLVEIIPEPTDDAIKTVGGIYIPKVTDEQMVPPVEGKILIIGAGIEKNNIEVPEEKVEVGEHILFSKYAGMQFEKYGRKFALLRITDIAGVLEE